MKIFSYIFKVFALILVGTFFACREDLPSEMDTSDKFTVINAIRIVNAGEDGDEILEGTINENAKEIAFPRIDPNTDFSRLRFEAETSDGARLEQNVYAVEFAEGVYQKDIIIKVINAPRVREYFVKLEQKVPPIGAEFATYSTFDFSGNPLGAPLYTEFTGDLTRGSSFDGEHVLIVSRATVPHLLKVSDLRNNVVNKINLNTTGVSGGGLFNWHSGALANGHVYIGNLTGGAALKLYYYDAPSSVAQTIMDLPVTSVVGAAVRFGEVMSVNLDENGNGYIYFGDNDNTSTDMLEMIRVTVNNHTVISSPTRVKPTSNRNLRALWKSFNRAGNSNYYLYTNNASPISVVDNAGTVSYTMKSGDGYMDLKAGDPRVIEFNKARYLLVTTIPINGSVPSTVLIYDITPGANVEEALMQFDNADLRNPVFTYGLMGNTNAAPAVQTGFHITKDGEGNDDKLLVYAGGNGQGFAIFEFSKKDFDD